MSIARNKERDLTTGPLVPKIILFALPLMATGILQLMFNAADLIIVGRFAPNGQEDIGAIGGTGPLINLVINLFIGLSVGTSVFTARYIGAGDREKTSQTVHTSMAVALIGGKWKLLILRNLKARPWRFNELQRDLDGISQKVLTDSLRQMMDDGLAYRRDYREMPPRVEYGLTELGRQMLPIIDALADFGNYYKSVME